MAIIELLESDGLFIEQNTSLGRNEILILTLSHILQKSGILLEQCKLFSFDCLWFYGTSKQIWLYRAKYYHCLVIINVDKPYNTNQFP